MKVCPYIALLGLALVGSAQTATEIRLSGIAINSTDPDHPTAAQMEIIVDHGKCTLTIFHPLAGSGPCHITSYNQISGPSGKSGEISIASDGPPAISWKGTIKGNVATGNYTIDVGHQSGSFYLALTRQPKVPATPPAPAVGARSSCSPAVESAITGEFHGWEGETIFKLDNGQIWQQAEYDYDYDYEYHPDVTIYQTSEGCRMKVEDDDETILVKRIK